MNYGAGINLTESARTLQARYYKGATKFKGGTTGVAIPIQCCRTKGIVGETNYSHTLMARDYKGIGNQEMTAVAIPVLTPDRAKKCQNGRRFKENGEPMFSLTAQDRHGVAMSINGHTVKDSENISHCLNANEQRKVFGAKQERTLVGVRYTADGFHLYRNDKKKSSIQGTHVTYQNGNVQCLGTTHVPMTMEKIGIIDPQGRNKKEVSPKDICPTLRSETHGNVPEVIKSVNVSDDSHNGIYVELPNGVICYAIWYEKEQCYITIRKLTPKECFRLQGWTDDYFEKAAFVNSDSRLYMQAGNGVTVDVTYAIGKKIAECEKESLEEFSKHMNKPEKAEQTKGERRWRD